MEKEFVPYVLSKQIKQLGFNEECFGYYVDVEVANPFLVINRISNTQGGYFTLAPLWQQAFGWFREKYELNFYIWKKQDLFRIVLQRPFENSYFFNDEFKSYEVAELECLKKLIEIIKDGKK